MHPTRTVLLASLISTLLLGCAAQQAAAPPAVDPSAPYVDPETLVPGEILHVATGRKLTPGEVGGLLKSFPIIYFGETHDSVEDHELQRSLLATLHQQNPKKVTLALEMLKRDGQEGIDGFLRGELDDAGLEELWAENWGRKSLPYYRDILVFARDNRIPILALNATKAVKKVVREHTLDAIPEDQREGVPEMDLDDPHSRAIMMAVLGSHGHGIPPDALERFIRMQALADETMAETVADYLQSEGNGRQVLVLTGGYHVAYGVGMPRRVFRRVPVPWLSITTHAAEIADEKKDKLMDVDLPTLPLPISDIIWAVRYRGLPGEEAEEKPEMPAKPKAETPTS